MICRQEIKPVHPDRVMAGTKGPDRAVRDFIAADKDLVQDPVENVSVPRAANGSHISGEFPVPRRPVPGADSP